MPALLSKHLANQSHFTLKSVKHLVCLALSFIVLAGILFTAGCIPITGDIFGGYARGASDAQRANYYDQQRAAQVRAQMINNDIAYFNQTGDYRALCHAAYLGSVEVANYLVTKKITCKEKKTKT